MERAIPDRFTRGGIMEMLPDVITDEEMSAMRRYVQREGMGLHEYKCADCGKVFIAHTEHRYRAEKKGMQLMYCSHRCFRKYEQKEEEAYRKRVMGAWVQKREKTPVERARERVEYVKKLFDDTEPTEARRRHRCFIQERAHTREEEHSGRHSRRAHTLAWQALNGFRAEHSAWPGKASACKAKRKPLPCLKPEGESRSQHRGLLL